MDYKLAIYHARGNVLKQTVLITGAGGQLGRELVLTAPPEVVCVAVDRKSLDICEREAVSRLLEETRPQLLINTAAYTAVDRAESEPEDASG